MLFASGADLQSINPLVTVHPLARQVQRYVLFTTLVRYDTLMRPQPYLATSWEWSDSARVLTMKIAAGVPWHDGVLTTAHDAAWTLNAARDSTTGYPRRRDLAAVTSVDAVSDTILRLRFSTRQPQVPDVLTDLAILPRHLLDSVPSARLRQAAFNESPVGNGPFRFVAHEANRRWVFARSAQFPAALGGPARLDRFIVVVVDEPATKLAALSSGELDFAGIQPAHADFVRRDPALRVITYPLLFTYGIVFNTRRAPFDQLVARMSVRDGIDRREIVDGYVFGFGTPASGPFPQDSAIATPSIESEQLPLDFELLTVGSGEAALEQLIQAQLAPRGQRVRIRQLELGAFLDGVYGPSHDFDAAVLGISGDVSGGHLRSLLAIAGDGLEHPGAVAERIFTDSVPVAFLYHARGVQGASRRVHGVRMDLRGELPTVALWTTAP